MEYTASSANLRMFVNQMPLISFFRMPLTGTGVRPEAVSLASDLKSNITLVALQATYLWNVIQT
jgi:hypothetical protein